MCYLQLTQSRTDRQQGPIKLINDGFENSNDFSYTTTSLTNATLQPRYFIANSFVD
jgi:hypothetical protein